MGAEDDCHSALIHHVELCQIHQFTCWSVCMGTHVYFSETEKLYELIATIELKNMGFNYTKEYEINVS